MLKCLPSNSVLLLLTTLFLLGLCSASHATFEVGTTSSSPTPIGQGTQYIEAPNAEQTIESILSNEPRWQTSTQQIFNRGYSNSDWWLKFDVINIGSDSQFYLEFDYPVLDYLDVYLVANNQIIEKHFMGDKLSFSERPLKHRLFILPLDLPSSQNIRVYVRAKSSSSLQVPIKLWHPEAHRQADSATNLVHGVYMGGILVIAIYNLLVYLTLRDKVYLIYVSYICSMLMFLASLNGWSFQYLWPESTSWNDTSTLIFLNGVLLFAVLFAKYFLKLSELKNQLSLQANILSAICLAAMLCYLWFPYNYSIIFLIPYAAFSCLWALSVGVYAWYVGQKSAGLYVISWTGLLVGGILLALSKFQIIPRNVITDQSVQLGSLLEAMLLSFALAQRINHERSGRIEAQEHALAVQKQANDELEENVAARTKELEIANQRLKELSDTDQLTGIKNRRYLDQYVDQEIIRARRYQHPVSILLIDIDHFKAVNDNFGHLVGDICIQAVASELSTQLRFPTDLAARYGGEEFCIVLPQTALEGGIVVAERIRKRIDQHVIEAEGFDQAVTVSIGIYSAIPEKTDTAKHFLENSDNALYSAKHNGRNRVESFQTKHQQS
jgi:diguanylate cyclase